MIYIKDSIKGKKIKGKVKVEVLVIYFYLFFLYRVNNSIEDMNLNCVVIE